MKVTLTTLACAGMLSISSQASALGLHEKDNLTTTFLTDTDSLLIHTTLTESLIKTRLFKAENNIQLPYSSQVHTIIENYLLRDRKSTLELLSKKDFYFTIFEETLQRHQLPEELKYVAVLESELKPEAVSYFGAMGLWQFMPETGARFGLLQNEYVDERVDPYKATEAACRYFKYLYDMFGDWHLVLAAYNCGEGNVMIAIDNAGGKKDFKSIYPYLPAQTQAYLPKFVAIAYVMNYADDHNIYASQTINAVATDIFTTKWNFNLKDFSRNIGVSEAEMKLLNPHLKKGVLPVSMRGYAIRYPMSKRKMVKPLETIEAKRAIAGEKKNTQKKKNEYQNPIVFPLVKYPGQDILHSHQKEGGKLSKKQNLEIATLSPKMGLKFRDRIRKRFVFENKQEV
ncbi:MAG: hypothetical protein EAZ55_06770 [Cytophagales bacterium]|nr:MAG: hypothetical protein EAZ55_06770 [Cytophagales bacterium]